MKKRISHTLRRARSLLAAVLSLAVLSAASAVSSYAAAPDYIVKRTDSDAPFLVVKEPEMRRLRHTGLLEWYEPDGAARLLDDPAFFDAEAQWNLDMIGAGAAFRAGALGQGVRVAVLDSGVAPHPDLEGRLLPGRNHIPEAEDPADTSDRYGHGTRVAGLIAAAGAEGYGGVAPGAEIVPLKLTDGKAVQISAICTAIYDAIDNYGCRVINLSLGVETDFVALREAVEYAEAQGAVIVAAAGNDGNGVTYYPAGYETVIGVGAVDRGGAWYKHSNHNPTVALTAPGADVRCTAADGGYTVVSGTSYAVPQVSGAAAVLLGVNGDLTPAEVRALLAESARDAGDAGYDEYFGWGILDLSACLAAMSAPAESSGGEDGGDVPEPPQEAEQLLSPEPPWIACLRDESCPMRAFSDLDGAAWYHDAVHYALSCGIMNGYDGGFFLPDAAASRAMLATILWRMEGAPSADDAYVTFADVEPAAWYAPAVRWAAAAGVFGGYSPEVFAPGDPVTREMLATVLDRYLRARGDAFEPPTDAPFDFLDAGEVSDWALASMRRIAARGVMQGTGGGILSPRAPATRAQLAAVLMRLAE